MAHFRVPNRKRPAEIIRALAAIQLVAVAQPNYVYTLQQQPEGNRARIARRHRPEGRSRAIHPREARDDRNSPMIRGNNVPVAVIDSEIDATHPDLEGVIAQSFDAVGAPEKPHPHGTGMAGAIASHSACSGRAGRAAARRARLLHHRGDAQSTTINIVKGIEWAVQQGRAHHQYELRRTARSILERAIKAAYDKGIVLIAAAGNAGPKSPPLFPAPIPNVIAVTATDVDDKLYTGANRGKYISVAAPGVDILVPAPEGELSNDHRNLGRGRACQRHRGADAGTQSETNAGRHSPHPDRERKAARARRARRQFRLRPDRSAAGAAVGGSENRDHDATAAAVESVLEPMWTSCLKQVSPRFHHAARRRCGGVAARGEGAADRRTMQRVGVLMPFTPDDPETRMRVAALKQGLRDPGLGR